MDTSHSQLVTLKTRDLAILHALRGFSALYVVVFHAKTLWAGGTEYLRRFPMSTWGIVDYAAFPLETLASAGYEMVIVFFVLSGFFIRHALTAKPRSTSAFYLNRIARIYPPYIVSLVLGGLVICYIAANRPEILRNDVGRDLNAGLLSAWNMARSMTGSDLIRVLLFLPIGKGSFFAYNNVYWSLLPEALFYIMAPFAFRYIRVYLIFSLVYHIVRSAALVYHAGWSLYLPLQYNIYFAVGVWLYDVMRRQPKWLYNIHRISRAASNALLCLLFALVVLSAQLRAHVYGHLVSEAVSTVFAVACILALLSGRIRRTKPIRVLEGIGQFSFSLYLFHLPLLFLAYCAIVWRTGNLVNYDRYYIAAIPAVVVGSLALYWVTERVSVKLMARLPA